MTEPKTLSDADVQAIADKTVQKLFEGFGFDISTPKGRLEAAGAFRHLIFWYRVTGMGFKAAALAGGTTAAVWLIWKFTGWSGPPK